MQRKSKKNEDKRTTGTNTSRFVYSIWLEIDVYLDGEQIFHPLWINFYKDIKKNSFQQ